MCVLVRIVYRITYYAYMYKFSVSMVSLIEKIDMQ